MGHDIFESDVADRLIRENSPASTSVTRDGPEIWTEEFIEIMTKLKSISVFDFFYSLVGHRRVTMDFNVAEAFLSMSVADMDRATLFYSESLGAKTTWSSPRWSSLSVAGVRIGLFANSEHVSGRVGLHFAVSDLDAACVSVSRAGGSIVIPASEVAPGVLVADVSDTEGNIFSLQKVSQ